LKPVCCPNGLLKYQGLELRWLPKHPRCLYGIFEVRCEEGLRTSWAVANLERVIPERDGQDVGDGAEDWGLFFAEEIDGADKSQSGR
jgi:hypothetical protein